MYRRAFVLAAAAGSLLAVAAGSPLGARTPVRVGPNVEWFALTAAPLQPLRFAVGSNATTYSLDVYPVSLTTFLAVRDRKYEGDDDFDATAVRHAVGRIVQRGWASKTVILDGLPIGLYVARLNAGDRTTYATVDVTSFGLVTLAMPTGTTWYAVDLKSFTRRPDVAIGPLDESAPPRKGDDAVVTLTGAGSGAAIARSADGSIVAAGAPRQPAPDAPATRSFGHTDRPLYHPGDRVAYRFIDRTGAPGSYAVPSGNAAIEIHDPQGQTVASAAPVYTSFGTVNGTYQIPADARLGNYWIAETDGTTTIPFSVEAYEKPEYVVSVTAKSGSVVAGDTARFDVGVRYYFGRPAAHMHLHYRVSTPFRYHPWFGRFLSFEGYGFERGAGERLAFEADAVTDRSGIAHLTIPTKSDQAGSDLQVDVDARDASGKTVTAASAIPLTAASFEIALGFDRWFATKNAPLAITLRSETTGGTPRPNVPIDLTFERWRPNDSQNDAPIATARVATDAHGEARYTWLPSEEGYATVRATALDERGRRAESTGGVWVTGTSYPGWFHFDRATLASDKSVYRPGEAAHFLVTSPQAGGDALVAVSSGGTITTFVHHIASIADTFDVTPPAGAPRFAVSIAIPTRHGIAYASATAAAAPAAHELHVTLSPDRPRYAPGDLARFTVDVRDDAGKPASAEIGIGVVDDALIALAPERTSDPFGTFYDVGPQAIAPSWNDFDADVPLYAYLPVAAIARVNARSAGPAFQPDQTADDQYTVSGQPMPAPPAAPSFANLRSDFRDTAYWSPSVVSDATGHAQIEFRWPDNLTSYTATGVAVTPQTDIGSGTGASLVTKDFLVRLSTPRFLRSGDRANFVASANGPKGATSARLRLDAPALGLDDRTVSGRFDGDASLATTWTAWGKTLAPATIRLAGTAGDLNDGLERTLPVESTGAAEHERWSGTLPGAGSLAYVIPPHADPGALRIDLSPSLVARLFNGVKLLDVYPYYCVEQTMSATLPLVDVEAMAKRTGLVAPKGLDPNAVAAHAIARLEQLQHDDGSWGWWENDRANPFMTAYALYGLTELARAGYTVPSDVVARGLASLKAQFASNEETLALWGGPQPNSLWNTRAYMLFAWADADPAGVDRKALAAVDAQIGTLNPYALAVLGLAHVELHDRTGAQPVLDELESRAHEAGGTTYWSGGGWHYRWEDDPVETTAYALRFIHAMNPSDPKVARSIAWLRAKAHGSWWYTTKDTAAAIYALSEALDPDRSEFAPHETVRVFLGRRLLASVPIESAILDDDRAHVDVPAALAGTRGTLRFEREGTGALYWDVDSTRYVHGTAASDLDPDDASAYGAEPDANFTVTRTYRSQSAGPWKVGDLIDVDVTVTSKADSQFVAVEDPLPAGLEYQPRLHETGDDWSGLQFFDDRVVFFTDQTSASWPLHLHYQLRATTAGSFTAAPPQAYAMYGPPVAALGHTDRVTIAPDQSLIGLESKRTRTAAR